MLTGRTFSGPRARQTTARVSAESMPPESPTTPRSKPTLRTSSRTNPVRISMTRSQSTASAPAASVRLSPAAVSVTFAAVQPPALGVDDVVALVAEHRVGDPGPAEGREVEAIEGHPLLAPGRLADQVSLWVDDPGASPEVDAVLVADAVAVDDIGGEELGVGPGDHVVALWGAELGSVPDPAARGRRRADDHVDAVAGEQVCGARVPEVLADEHAHPPGAVRSGGAQRSLEGSEPVAGGEITGLVEEAVGGQVHLAVHVDHGAPREVEGCVVEAVVVALQDAADHGVHAAR